MLSETLLVRLVGRPMLRAMASNVQPHAPCAPALTKPLPQGTDPLQVVNNFMATINMEPKEMERFLETEESRRAILEGQEEELEGRHLARRVIELLEKVGERKADPHAYELSLLYEADRQQMHQITEYIHCQTEQAQQADSLQRYHLMNCGYDPLKVQAKQSHGGSGGGDTGSQDV